MTRRDRDEIADAVGDEDHSYLPEVLTVDEAAAFLRIGRNLLYDAIGRGEIPHRRIGRQIRLSRSALVAWLGAGAWESAGKG